MPSAEVRIIVTCVVISAAISGAAGESPAGADAQWLAIGRELARTSPAVQNDSASSEAGGVDATTQPAGCQSRVVCCAEKPWEVKFFVYGWLPAINGRAGPRPVASVDFDFRDTLRGTECAVPFDLEARLGDWGFIFDFYYTRLTGTVEVGPFRPDLLAKRTIMELTGYYRAVNCPVWPGNGSTLTFDLLGGARYNRLDETVSQRIDGITLSQSRVTEWWDPLVGGRAIWQTTEQLSFFARADVGGYGLPDASHIVWQFVGGAEYDFTRNIFAQVGYRLLHTEFGGGNSPFTYDITLSGPYLAVGVKF